MIFRMIQLNAIAFALLLVTGQTFAADATKEATHKGKVVSITSQELVMTTKGGKEHTHALTAETKLTLDGAACKAEDIKAGERIRVTTHTTGEKVAIMEVEALHKHHMFANSHEGTFVSLTDKKLVMKDAEGKEHSHVVSADTKMCCDGKDCKAAAMKAGMKIRVTTKRGDKGAVSEIEALDMHAEYDQDDQAAAAAKK